MAEDPDAPYSVEEVPVWDPAKFHVTREAWGLLVVGPCPKCGHDVSKHLNEDAILAFRNESEATEDPTAADPNVIHCNCVAETHHGGQPGRGCGRYWGAEVARR